MKKSKQLMTGFLAITVAIIGILSTTVTNATEITEQKVFYEKGDDESFNRTTCRVFRVLRIL